MQLLRLKCVPWNGLWAQTAFNINFNRSEPNCKGVATADRISVHRIRLQLGKGKTLQNACNVDSGSLAAVVLLLSSLNTHY